jgi:hypothetical protein
MNDRNTAARGMLNTALPPLFSVHGAMNPPSEVATSIVRAARTPSSNAPSTPATDRNSGGA